MISYIYKVMFVRLFELLIDIVFLTILTTGQT